MSETEELLSLFERAGLIDRLPESVRWNEANNLEELFGSEQRVLEIFRIKSAAARTWQQLYDDNEDDCIRQPVRHVTGLLLTHRHVLYRKRNGGVTATCQWSHMAHLALKGTHLHSKDENGDWIHCPEIDDRRGVDLSHLCHVGDCINKNHIDFEPWWINLARNCCRYAGYCLGDEVHPGVRPCIFTRTTLLIIRAGTNIPSVEPLPGNFTVPRENQYRHRSAHREKTPAQQAYDTERRREAQRNSRRTFEQRSVANKKGWKTRKRNMRKKKRDEQDRRSKATLNSFVGRAHRVMSSSSLNVEEA